MKDELLIEAYNTACSSNQCSLSVIALAFIDNGDSFEGCTLLSWGSILLDLLYLWLSRDKALLPLLQLCLCFLDAVVYVFFVLCLSSQELEVCKGRLNLIQCKIGLCATIVRLNVIRLK